MLQSKKSKVKSKKSKGVEDHFVQFHYSFLTFAFLLLTFDLPLPPMTLEHIKDMRDRVLVLRRFL
jgi:hypothetical protein